MYLCDGTVALGVPLLAVQTDDDPLSQEKGRPHDDVPYRTSPPVVEDEVEHHCDRGSRVSHGAGGSNITTYPTAQQQ